MAALSAVNVESLSITPSAIDAWIIENIALLSVQNWFCHHCMEARCVLVAELKLKSCTTVVLLIVVSSLNVLLLYVNWPVIYY